MGMFKCAAAAAILALCVSACATAQGNQGRQGSQQTTPSDPEHSPDQNLGAAIAWADAAARSYRARGRSVRANRTWINYGILAARTFVTGAAGLEAHPDTIFIGALTGTTLHQLDPIINAGGRDAWYAAHAGAVCVRGAARSANTQSMIDDIAMLTANSTRRDASTTLSSYNTFPADVVAAVDQIEGYFIASTTSDLLDATALETRINAHQQRIDGVERSLILTEEEIVAAVARVRETLQIARESLAACTSALPDLSAPSDPPADPPGEDPQPQDPQPDPPVDDPPADPAPSAGDAPSDRRGARR